MAKYEMPTRESRVTIDEALPIATKKTLGAVRVGNDLNIDIDGALNVNKIDIKSIDDLNTLLNPDYKFLNGTGLKEFENKINSTLISEYAKKTDIPKPYELQLASENKLGGIKAKAKTNENKEVAIDTASGKLFVASDKVSVDNFESGNNISITSGTSGKVKISAINNILEFTNKTSFPSTGESGKIYIAKDTSIAYYWTGFQYVEFNSNLALGETSSTAYPGDKGKKNADDIVTLQTGKQDTLVSGTNIKTINNQSLLGSGNIEIQGGTATVDYATNEEVIALFSGGGY